MMKDFEAHLEWLNWENSKIKWDIVDNKPAFKTYKGSINDAFISGAEIIGLGTVLQYREVIRDWSIKFKY